MQDTGNGPPPGDNERLLRGLVEIWGQGIVTAGDSAQDYDVLHAQGRLRQRASFYKWLLGLLDAQPGQQLLDISCGQGALLAFAAQAGLRATGLDLAASALATAARVVPAGLCLANAEQLPFPADRFDLVTNVGSVEHYFRPAVAVQEAARVLRPEGLALILLPNTFGLLGNVLHVWRTGDVFDDGQPLQRYGTPGQWCRLLEMNGLAVQRTVKYEREWPRTWPDAAWYARRPYKLIRAALSAAIPTSLASFLIYLCRKKR